MKRYGQLWSQIVAFENLLQASRQAQQGKRYRPNVLAFNYKLDQELLRLQAELTGQTYTSGGYRTFIGDTYANRLGYGTHRALKRFTHFARTSRYILQGDIRKYFPIWIMPF
jgi:hypothetical protein